MEDKDRFVVVCCRIKQYILLDSTSYGNLLFAYAKTKAQISCAVTAQLISAFVFPK